MELKTTNNQPPTEQEKADAIELLRKDVNTYTTSNSVIYAQLQKMFRWILGLAVIKITLMCLCLSGCIYLIFLKPPSATERDIKDIQAERQQLQNQRKMLNYDKDDLQKEKQTFIRLKIVQDSTYTALMKNIYKQDSISKLKQPIKADIVNAKTVNTVNTKSVNLKK